MTSGLIYVHRSLPAQNKTRNRLGNIQTKVDGKLIR